MAQRKPVCVEDLERFAVGVWSKPVRDFIQTGAGCEITLGDNRKAFNRYKIRARVGIDVSKIDTKIHVLGHQIAFPVCIAPVGLCQLVSPLGEVDIARATFKKQTIYSLSSCSTRSLDDIFWAVPRGLNFYQLYFFPSRQAVTRIVQKVESLGFKSIMVTLDTPTTSVRYEDERNYFHLSADLKVAVVEEAYDGAIEFQSQDDCLKRNADALAKTCNDQLTWADVRWLTSITKLPIVAKGVLTGEDAILAVEHGAAGIIVSNHGGRKQDALPATANVTYINRWTHATFHCNWIKLVHGRIDALREVVKAVEGRCEVYLDSGVRTGTDVFKAIALGASAVFVGRPALYGLAYKGEEGVCLMLDMLRKEFVKTMQFAGCTTASDIKPDMVVHESYYHQSRL